MADFDKFVFIRLVNRVLGVFMEPGQQCPGSFLLPVATEDFESEYAIFTDSPNVRWFFTPGIQFAGWTLAREVGPKIINCLSFAF